MNKKENIRRVVIPEEDTFALAYEEDEDEKANLCLMTDTTSEYENDEELTVPIKDAFEEDFKLLGIIATLIPQPISTFKFKYLNLQNLHP
ncbi:hypothetical protein CR513_36624, partial [Mucuna pruriens]